MPLKAEIGSPTYCTAYCTAVPMHARHVLSEAQTDRFLCSREHNIPLRRRHSIFLPPSLFPLSTLLHALSDLSRLMASTVPSILDMSVSNLYDGGWDKRNAHRYLASLYSHCPGQRPPVLPGLTLTKHTRPACTFAAFGA